MCHIEVKGKEQNGLGRTRLRERLPKDKRECTAEIMLWYGNVFRPGEGEKTLALIVRLADWVLPV
jgi:hypothetical protein